MFGFSWSYDFRASRKPSSVVLLECLRITEIRFDVHGIRMICCEHNLVNHYISAARVDPDISQGPVVLVEFFFVVFEINGVDML